MILGVINIPQVANESICRNSENDYFAEVGDYKIHSQALMPLIQFDTPKEMNDEIDSSIFINEDKLSFKRVIKSQNYITCRYIGRAPLKFYGPKTPRGTKFLLICRDNSPNYNDRYFGTEDAIRGFNRSSNDASYYHRR